jgi:hypothetical protein
MVDFTVGYGNTVLGYQAGYSLFSGDNNVLIGNGVTTTDSDSSNEINIANLIFATGATGSGA